MDRTNLDVLTYATVTNILTAGNSTSLKAFGVVAASQSTGEVLVIVPDKEVILSAGTFQTPQLLMVSVSDASQYRESPLMFVLRESDQLMNLKEMVSQLWSTILT
jgi:choline dehydrogenase-like flavoprotein